MEKERNYELTIICPICGSHNKVMVNEDDYIKYRKNTNMFIATAFPYLTIDERELLISGTCPTCWNKYLNPDTLIEVDD